MIRAVFLDQGGVLESECVGARPSRLMSDVFEGLRLLQHAGYTVIVVTHQIGVAKGVLGESDVHRIKEHLEARLIEEDVPLGGFYYCPHHPDGQVRRYAVHCLCRRPQPGLLIRAASELAVDMAQSWMVGATLDDMETGRWVGCRTVLLTNGHETEWNLTEPRWPDYIAGTLLEASQLIALSSPRGVIQIPIDRISRPPLL
ncbi:MAG: D,D-heptose 1,7-bisphosphate phosphatase [Nitrospira sp.]